MKLNKNKAQIKKIESYKSKLNSLNKVEKEILLGIERSFLSGFMSWHERSGFKRDFVLEETIENERAWVTRKDGIFIVYKLNARNLPQVSLYIDPAVVYVFTLLCCGRCSETDTSITLDFLSDPIELPSWATQIRK